MANSCVKMTPRAPSHSCLLVLQSFSTRAWWILALSSWNMPEPSGKEKSIDWITWSIGTFRNSADLLCWDQLKQPQIVFSCCVLLLGHARFLWLCAIRGSASPPDPKVHRKWPFVSNCQPWQGHWRTPLLWYCMLSEERVLKVPKRYRGTQ